ncbi:MAG TPA: hypothetical protein VNW04_01635 [Puia sp.]|nr:hypothetical protein [Puia sp.]
MFGIFKKDLAPQCPLKEDRRQWVEHAFHWLTTNFDKEGILHRKVLLPHHSDFPIRYNGDPQTAHDTLHIVATQMQIDPADIQLNLYDDTINAISTGSPNGSKLYLGAADSEPQTDEPFYGRNADGKYPITVERSKLQNPELLVAKLAREGAHIKLQGEGRIAALDEPLTDLTTLIFGLGIFNANAVFTSQNLHITGKNARLTQMEWGYALAVFARFRNEKNPAWANHLVKNIKSDFGKSEQYLTWHNPQTPPADGATP